ncbi:serine/threonine-protein kinase [Streptomyces sp. WMMC500]|uniref:serine/threonine-protein kinase n=1 Tax=Streptomyces sp. WMMC500 TaxID=3015154 RepID=UPI00248BA9D1|nr:serine/threonine-protein kinase [Streptomyces sp. WMMC500]WBB58799.1 serine/threonine-protein kinase [Streptomyces sp. WMMC500]
MSETGLQGVVLDGRYELAEPLDAGAVGEMWRARDRTQGGEVAVQLLPPPEPAAVADGAEERARFEQVARRLAGLDSPHLAAVVGHGTTELAGRTGRGYLALAPLRGRSLGQVLREPGGIDWRRALAWAEQICRGLAAAHAVGLAHGALQPAGVLIDNANDDEGSEHGRVTVLDTALAECTGADLPPAEADAGHVGAVAYLAPECGTAAPAGAPADVYAIGCLLYEMLAGRPPYAGTVAEVLEQHQQSLPLRPSRAVHTVPEAVDDLVFTLMARQPADRPAHAGQAAAAIAALRAKPPAPRADVVDLLHADTVEPAEGQEAGEDAEVMPAPPATASAAPPATAAQVRRADRRRRMLGVTGAVLVVASGVLGYLTLTAYDRAEVLDSVQRATEDLNYGGLNDEGLTVEEAAEQALDRESGWLRLRTSDPYSTVFSGWESDAAAFEVTNLLGQHPVCMRVATVPAPAFVASYSPGRCGE